MISHLGARPEASLAELAAPLLAAEPTLDGCELPRYRTGDAELDAEIAALVDGVGDPADADLSSS